MYQDNSLIDWPVKEHSITRKIKMEKRDKQREMNL
jgi:type III secretory pathway component EscU